MRIVHVSLRYPPATGGAERYVHDIVERTRNIDAGRDVRVLTSSLKTHGPITPLAPEALLDDPMYVQRLHAHPTPFLSYPRLQALSYYLGHHKPDIIHGYSFWYQPADVAARYAQKHNLKFIFHPIYYDHGGRKKPIWQLYQKTIGRKTFAAADVVVVISPQEQHLIEQAGMPVKRFELIPPGIDSTVYERKRLDPFLKRNISGKILLAVGRISQDKGLDDVFRVLPEVIKAEPTAQLCIIGEDFGAQSSLHKLAQSNGIENHVHWLGRFDDEELIGAYQHATVFVHPSHYEAFGIVLAESLAAGTPVVARNASAIPFVVPHNQAGILFSNPQELTSALLTLLRDTKVATQYGSFGKTYVQKTFSWDTSIAKILKLYEES